MALSANKVSAVAAPGMAAAATARPLSGGRGVAAENQSPVEAPGFAQQISANDNAILRYDDQNGTGSGGGQYRNPNPDPFLNRAGVGFTIEDTNSSAAVGNFSLSDLRRVVGIYEYNVRITSPDTVRPGSVLNRLY
ncbi:MAG: hypothetical protein M0006_06585 [Magnetospirillum sp.]|nr:hypothetical protein [Magnetospirillum sp.]